MKIKSISIENFRGYDNEIAVDVGDMLALVGKNDIGKSTILEALDIFFNEGKGCTKQDKGDINKASQESGNDTLQIAVEFTELPLAIVIDATNETTLENEYLLTASETLRVVKQYPHAGKAKVYIRALHPTHPDCSDLLLKKITELRKIVNDRGLPCPDKTRSAELRTTIWKGVQDLQLEECNIEVAKIDSKQIWDQLRSYMPLFNLFQSDRKNSDDDSEVQDPMRLAVKEILSDPGIQAELSSVAENVKRRLEEVADRTLGKLRDFNEDIASSLNPDLPEAPDLKWPDVFKNVSISGDNDIPINKRGSGVKRLVLISFFMAEAERRKAATGVPSIVYAIEEPETSQHPQHQRYLVNALIELSEAQNTQVMITTHSPEIVKRLDFASILVIGGRSAAEMFKVGTQGLPYSSLNEVNYTAFSESTFEYHNELYGYIEAEGKMPEFKEGKPLMDYKQLNGDGSIKDRKITLTEYIRHQIHHPENHKNNRFTRADLDTSIAAMRTFIHTMHGT